MPIGVTRVVRSSRLSQRISVVRRAETISNGGLSVQNPTTFPNIIAVVEPESTDLVRGTDRQEMPRTLTVWTPFRLRGPSPGFQPDLVLWHGDQYLVTYVDDFTDYGNGYIMAKCESIDSMDLAAVQPVTNII